VALALLRDQPLKALNTFGLPATAATLVRVEHPDDLADLPDCLNRLCEAAQAGPALILGGGSNWLPIGRIHSPLVQYTPRGQQRLGPVAGDAETALVQAEAGTHWDHLVRWSLQHGLSGLENLSLIPGTVGGAPLQNIGAYGVELAACFDSLDAMHLQSGQQRRFDRDECAFGYRDSIFKHAAGRGWLITRVRLRLRSTPSGALNLDYGDLRAWLREAGVDTPTASDVARAVRAIRRSKLPDPAVLGNAGSFFKNPIVDAGQAQSLRERHPAMPMWPVTDARRGGDSEFKLAAAWMIEQCGWRGVREGDAGVHQAHALVLVNHGSAQGQEIVALADRIVRSVQDRFGVTLEPEPLIVRGELPG
jgi:UDP-N-acetylmuramate dehydrogenase